MVASLALLVVFQSTNLWRTFTVDSTSDLVLLYALLTLNFIAFVVFAFIFLRSIVKLIRERRTFQTGAQIKTRLLISFFAVSLLPIIAMAVFSYLFMNRALDRWFSQIPQQIEQARGVGRTPALDASIAELERLSQQQQTIRRTAMSSLGVLTFLLIFASMWIAFYLARGLTTPIKALAEGAEEIASGNFAHRVDVLAEDELALLVNAFNDMSARLEANSAALREGRRYIETVLQTLPTGVISFDPDNRVSTINDAARTILEVSESRTNEATLNDIVSGDVKNVFERLIARSKRTGHAADQIVLETRARNGGDPFENKRTVAITAASLPGESGVVFVLEDLSELIAAQRSSAWQEVARRMAHEIKNPLTPIQLSAERIAKRYERTGHVDIAVGKRIDDKGPMGDVVHESTATILREVSSLKSMVDEFSKFARLPDVKLEPGDVVQIAYEAVAAFDGKFSDITIEVNNAEQLPDVLLDAEQLKRVFVNLVENSAEAFEPGQQGKTIAINLRHDAARDIVVAEVLDNGKGISQGDLQKLFQPYFSTKGRGTGLGLAIVNRIIAEHHGKIHVAANQPHGAKFTIELPVN